MRRRTLSSLLPALLAAPLLLWSCGGETAEPPTAPTPADTPPPMGAPAQAAPQGPSIPPPPPPAESAELSWSVPEGWEEVQPDSAMRRAQYRVPGEAGDAELIVFYFGPGQGGDAMSNARRWAAQFVKPDGQPLQDEDIVIDNRAAGDVSVLIVEAAGTYVGGMGTATAGGLPQQNHMILGAVAEGPDSNWFFKLLGPEATVESNRGAFDELIASLR